MGVELVSSTPTLVEIVPLAGPLLAVTVPS
jgi:hypothetical protein